MTRIDNIFERISEIVDGRNLLSLREQLLVDCADQILLLMKARIIDIEKAALLAEDLDIDREALAKCIRDLK